MLTNNAANMKWVEHQKRDNTSAVTKQSVVNLISWVNSNALTKPKQAGKKAGTCASEPHTLSPKALGRHPVFRLGRVKKPDLFPGALGHRAFHLVSHAELAWAHSQAHQQADQFRFLVWFPPHALHPAARHPQWEMCCPVSTRRESCLRLLSRSGLLPENSNFLQLLCPAQARPSVTEAGSGWVHDDVLSRWSKYQD